MSAVAERSPRHTTRPSRGGLLGILGLALIIRLAFVLGYPQVEVTADAAAYDHEASQLLRGRGILSEAWAGRVHIAKGPGYPLFLAAIYRVFGYHHTAVRVVQALISVAAVWLIYALGTMVFHHEVGLVAALLAAVYPPFISYPGWLLTETLSVLLLLGFVCCLLRAMRGTRLMPWAVTGVIGGLLVLHREETLVIVLLSSVVAWWRRAGRRQVAALVCAAALAVLPWTLRNALVFHDFVLVSTTGGAQVWLSTYPQEWDGWRFDDPHFSALVAGRAPLQQDRVLRQEGIKTILTHPLTYLKLCMKRIPRFWVGGHSNTFARLERDLGWYVSQRDYIRVMIKLAMLGYNLGLLTLGCWGFWLAWRIPRAEAGPVVLL
ncbi:MAG: glycosyltransferase family 39 protein, partial [Candidatus Omnitrophica bacterium]|nr:glycosyltransferase family 39 protein [Candidatus Omnitrophota bacterium]